MIEQSVKKLQELSIRIFFDTNLQKMLVKNPEQILEAYEISKQNMKFLPNPLCKKFIAESSGRRSLIAREINKRFSGFFKLILGRQMSNVNDVAQTQIFNEFISSDFFFTNAKSFPHYTGVGKGYENSSKFFLFCVNLYNAKESSHNKTLHLLELYTGIAAHLNFQSQFCKSIFFNNFAQGVFFTIDQKSYYIFHGARVELKNTVRIESENGNLNRVVEEYLGVY